MPTCNGCLDWFHDDGQKMCPRCLHTSDLKKKLEKWEELAAAVREAHAEKCSCPSLAIVYDQCPHRHRQRAAERLLAKHALKKDGL